jgi:hypothetical protein
VLACFIGQLRGKVFGGAGLGTPQEAQRDALLLLSRCSGPLPREAADRTRRCPFLPPTTSTLGGGGVQISILGICCISL